MNTKTLKDSVWAEKCCHLFKILVVNKKDLTVGV